MAVVLVRPVGLFSDPAVQRWADRFVDDLQRSLDDLAAAAVVGIVTTNVTPPTTFNPPTATLPQTAQALGTLLAALKQIGRTT